MRYLMKFLNEYPILNYPCQPIGLTRHINKCFLTALTEFVPIYFRVLRHLNIIIPFFFFH